MESQGIQWATTANQRESQLLAIVDELRTQLQELQQQQQQQRTTTKTRQVLPEPDRFTGRTKDWDTWSMAMRAKLRIDGDAIGGNEAQFYYVYSSLGAKVQGLVLSFVRQAQEEGDWKPFALMDYLGRMYDDPNKAKKAGQRLIESKQGTMSVAAYLPQFEKTMFEAGAGSWPDDAKITTLVGGLNKYTRQRIDGQLSLPTDYDGFTRMLQTLGNQFGPSYSNDNGSSNGSGYNNAMEWEPVKAAAARTAPSISREQRQKWRESGKCVRCGSGEHWVGSCKYKPTRSRSSSFSSMSSDNSNNGRLRISASAVQTSLPGTTAKSEHLSKENQWIFGPLKEERGRG